MLSTILIGGWPLVQVLLAGGLILAAVVLAAVQAWRSWPTAWMGSVLDGDDARRGADDPAPAGVVEYARDLEEACKGADADFWWEMLTAGATRDQARDAWIGELLKSSGGE